jgi:hypothetical protein
VLTSFLELNERQQLWGIYDDFDGFERQMEDALVGIFDKDVPPSVTAVAASVTQSSTTSPVQAIIHCPLPALSSC